MSLKQKIKRNRILKNRSVELELEIPGEPMIYSIKYSIGSRTRSVQFFRNMQWASLIKSYFCSYVRSQVPVVIIVKFYVSPPESVRLSTQRLKAECVPAVQSYELCDYLLSFLEMLHHVLINSYRQVVKIESTKFYSLKPRTVFQFMKWEDYVNLQNNSTIQSQSKSIGEGGNVSPLQPELQGDVTDEGVCSIVSKEHPRNSHSAV